MILGAGMVAIEAQRLLQEDSGSSEEVKLRHLTHQLVQSEPPIYWLIASVNHPGGLQRLFIYLSTLEKTHEQ